MKWITCGSCDEEFRVISESIDPVQYCPFCGSDIFDEEDDEDDDDDDD